MSESKQPKKQPKPGPRGPKPKRDRELTLVTYLFVGLFTLLTGYFIYFEAVLSPEVINNPYNARQDAFADRVVRGKILASTVFYSILFQPEGLFHKVFIIAFLLKLFSCLIQNAKLSPSRLLH